jgi:CHAD domain-containing protein
MRDLDVYEETIAAGEDGAAGLPESVKQSIARARKAASGRLVGLLGSKRFAELLASFSGFAGNELPVGVQRRWRSLRIRGAIAGDLRKSLKRVLKLGRKIDAETDVEVLHELRIRAKRLRYEAEFYAGFSPDLGKLMHSAKQLQDLLGSHRDALAAADRLRLLAREVKSEARAASADANPAAAIVPLIRFQNEQAASLRRSFPGAWRRFEKAAAKSGSRN